MNWKRPRGMRSFSPSRSPSFSHVSTHTHTHTAKRKALYKTHEGPLFDQVCQLHQVVCSLVCGFVLGSGGHGCDFQYVRVRAESNRKFVCEGLTVSCVHTITALLGKSKRQASSLEWHWAYVKQQAEQRRQSKRSCGREREKEEAGRQAGRQVGREKNLY